VPSKSDQAKRKPTVPNPPKAKTVKQTEIKPVPAVKVLNTPKYTDDEGAFIEELLQKSKDKHEVYVGMIKHFGQRKGVDLYHEIKMRFKKTLSSGKGKNIATDSDSLLKSEPIAVLMRLGGQEDL
jgi:hypothetical protein